MQNMLIWMLKANFCLKKKAFFLECFFLFSDFYGKLFVNLVQAALGMEAASFFVETNVLDK